MVFSPGQQIEDYLIVRPLGRGGLGAVYEASHAISQRSEALKVLLPEQTGTGEMAERFLREVRLLASLNHPNIAGLHHAFRYQDQLVMVMELVLGEDLRAQSRRTRIPLSQLMHYGIQILAGLDYAHQRGVVHRDIKPANIMVTPEGAIKLLDFGIAITDRSQDLTQVGLLIGSPLHMSPEQFRGEKATPQSDIYSLGITLYELIAGQPPFTGANTYELMMAQLHQPPLPLVEVRGDIPPALSYAIDRALQKSPAMRFATAGEFAAALAAVLEGGGSGAQTSTTRVPINTWQRTNTDELSQPTPQAGASTDALVRHLATFIGPIARVLVGRLSKQIHDLDSLYAEAPSRSTTRQSASAFCGRAHVKVFQADGASA